MAISNRKKTADMRAAVDRVLAGEMNYTQAADACRLHKRAVMNACCRARREQRLPGLHPALIALLTTQEAHHG